MRRPSRLRSLPLVLLGPVLVGFAQHPAPDAGPRSATSGRSSVDPRAQDLRARWDARHVEHLWNRAGFGASTDEVARWVPLGPEALVEHLLAERAVARYPFEPVDLADPAWRELPEDQRRAAQREAREADRRLAQDYLGWWMDRMVDGADPLRERMTLVWHGLFTSGSTKVRRGHLMIDQGQLLRRHALGNYGQLLHAILVDPAMLVYLDNTSNRRGKPNENLARELLELFSLGEGNYTEEDVRQAARVLTGHGIDGDGTYLYRARQHDTGSITVLGLQGHLGVADLADHLLRQGACARHVTHRLLLEFEGVEPGELRLQHYARVLEEQAFELRPFLRTLFLDPDFYREEVVGAKVLSPVDYLVGICRRTGLRPPAQVLLGGSASLGMTLFDPPSVQGWVGGDTWISTSTLMRRGNLAGLLLGVVRGGELRDASDLTGLVAELRARALGGEAAREASVADADGMRDSATEDGSMEGADDGTTADSMQVMAMEAAVPKVRADADLARALAQLDRAGYQVRLGLRARYRKQGCTDDRAVVDALLADVLAIEAPEETRVLLTGVLAREREALGLAEEAFLVEGGGRAEELLRRLAHLALSLPEAQLG